MLFLLSIFGFIFSSTPVLLITLETCIVSFSLIAFPIDLSFISHKPPDTLSYNPDTRCPLHDP